MTEITSFNEIFAEAKRAELLLNSFHQLPSGVFVANWRRGEIFFNAARHERPFDALLAAFRTAETLPALAAVEDLF
jgi:hypothetical protein